MSTPRSGSGTRRPAATSPRRSSSARPLPRPSTSAAIRPDGRELAVGATDGTVRLWDLSTGRVRRTLSGHTGKVVGLAYDRGGLRLASTSALGGPTRDDARPGGELKLWDVATGRELLRGGIGD